MRPQTLGQASRIPGVTPAAVSLLHVHLEVGGKAESGATGLREVRRKLRREPARRAFVGFAHRFRPTYAGANLLHLDFESTHPYGVGKFAKA